MKPITLLLFCGLAASLPVAVNHENTPDAQHSPPPTRIRLADLAALDAEQELPIDNRPQSPSPYENPSVVLAAPKPIQSIYLLSLGKDARKAAAIAAATASPDKAGVDQSTALPATDRSTRAHTHGCLYRNYMDMAVVCFVALFLLAIVVVESKGSARSCAREGAIRLDTEQEHRKQPLSIQAMPSARPGPEPDYPRESVTQTKNIGL